MLSPLFDNHDFIFEEGWDMTMFHREAATFTDREFWADIEAEAESMVMVPPAPAESDDGIDDLDWSVAFDLDEHKDKLVHHDCMWAGSCADSAHPANTFVPSDLFVANPGQSLLKRSASPARPETPPPSLEDDEPPEFRHAVDVAGTARRLLRDSAAVAADHSYTIVPPSAMHCCDSLGVQTPSDSEEEIDVVSVSSEKNGQVGLSARADSLPRVPSALDRHHIQRTVASAITTRRAPSAATTPRKRVSPSSPPASYSPARKRGRGPGRRARRSSPESDYSDAEIPDLEKRSLHNDMERMRRIGLKNLFDQLKDEVPATREKERAPKVVILREAANLCRRLQVEERERDVLRRHQTRLLAKLKKLRSIQYAARHQTAVWAN